MTATISLSNSAMFELLMSALEAYTVKHGDNSHTALETLCQLWGYANKTHPFKCTIEHVSTETSATRARDSVAADSASLAIKKDIAKLFGERYQHLGTFHTHPWLRNESPNVQTATDVRRQKLYSLSEADHASEICEPTLQIGQHAYSIALVMTLFPMQRANDSRVADTLTDLHEFSIGNIKFWLKGQVFEHKALHSLTENDRTAFAMYGLDIDDYAGAETLPIPVETVIEADFFSHLTHYLQEFGRIEFNARGKATYIEARHAEQRFLHKK